MRVGLDVGGTKTDAIVVGDDGEVVVRVRLATRLGPEGVVGTIIDAITALGEAPGVTAASFSTVGIGMPGQVVPGTSRVRHALNLGVADLDVAAALAPSVSWPVQVENDVKAAAVGAFAWEQHRLPGAAATSISYLNLGTGIASGTVLAGELCRGSRGGAGEIGHISIDPSGPGCRCGGRGCIEAFAGGDSIARRWGHRSALPVKDVFDHADGGDLLAIELRTGLTRAVAAAVRILILTADVDVVMLGGGLTALADRFLPQVRTELDSGASGSLFLGSLHMSERVMVVPPESWLAPLGAAVVGGRRSRKEVNAHG